MKEIDARKRMNELTDSIHMLFSGFYNGFYTHKDEHLRLDKENKALTKKLDVLTKCECLFVQGYPNLDPVCQGCKNKKLIEGVNG